VRLARGFAFGRGSHAAFDLLTKIQVIQVQLHAPQVGSAPVSV
jgi:hypothetical protein